ncbi:MAG: DUF1073 domain-containing protein [Burkholderia gladioli]
MKKSKHRPRRAASAEPVEDKTKKLSISYAALSRFQNGDQQPALGKKEIAPYKPMPGVVPADKQDAMLAMDAALQPIYAYASEAWQGMGFMGYPYLAELSQRPEYRKMSEVIAKEMTRKWIKLQSIGDDDKSEKIALLDKAIKKFDLRTHFREAAEQDGLFGRSQIYIDVNTPGGIPARADADELKTILVRSSAKISKGGLRGFKVIEPIWTTPYLYNSDEPMRPDFFKPQTWFVMGKEIHASRLLNFVSREVPDLLKPSYKFGGLSLTQIAIPYVENWLRTRQSVSDLISAFSIPVLKTVMEPVLQGDSGNNVFHRLDLFNKMRNNRGSWAIDKETEEFQLFNVPLSGLDKLQAQAQEQMSSVSSIPLIKLLGITPTGLNATAEDEIRVFYDWIHSLQESMFQQNLTRALEVIQLSEFGEIDPEISFKFEPLWQMDEEALSRIRKSDAEAGAAYIAAGVINPQEERERIADDEASGYHSLDVSDPAGDDDLPLDDEADE